MSSLAAWIVWGFLISDRCTVMWETARGHPARDYTGGNPSRNKAILSASESNKGNDDPRSRESVIVGGEPSGFRDGNHGGVWQVWHPMTLVDNTVSGLNPLYASNPTHGIVAGRDLIASCLGAGCFGC